MLNFAYNFLLSILVVSSLVSSFMLVQVSLVCLLGVDGSIMVADGQVRPCFHWFLEAYATLEGSS